MGLGFRVSCGFRVWGLGFLELKSATLGLGFIGFRVSWTQKGYYGLRV